MARIATCTPCGFQFYDSSETRTTCNRCENHKRERKAKVDKWKRIIAEDREKGKFASMLRWNIIQMWKREGLTNAEMAECTGLTEAEIRLEMGFARQDAR